MFYIDLTLEDTRIIVSDAHKTAERKAEIDAIRSGDHSIETIKELFPKSADLKGTITDLLGGESIDVEMSFSELSLITSIGVAHDGVLIDENVTACVYEKLAPWLAKYEMQPGGANDRLRPIP